jgi:riboflavin biosynthesis pyrimidine reductase
MKRPYIICHMASTVDGKIIVDNWGDSYKRFSSLYEQCHDSFDSQAWMVGRVTMEKDFTEGLQPTLIQAPKPIDRIPFKGDEQASSFAIAVDPRGKLGWESNEIEGDHVIALLTEPVSDDYLQYLQQQGVSYLFAGKDSIDFGKALEQLQEVFGIKTLMLEGGGHINGSLLNEGLIDELSLLILPLADGTPDAPTTFEVSKQLTKNSVTELKLNKVEQLTEDVLWLRYTIKH